MSHTAGSEMRNASVAFVNGDRSILSGHLRDAMRPPELQSPAALDIGRIDDAVDRNTWVASDDWDGASIGADAG